MMTSLPLQVSEEDLKRHWGLPSSFDIEGAMLESKDWVLNWYQNHPSAWICLKSVPSFEWIPDGVRIGDISLKSAVLKEKFLSAGVDHLVVAAMSAGLAPEKEAAHWWKEGYPDRYYFLETTASAQVEDLSRQAGVLICRWAEKENKVALPAYSPGYRGWETVEQVKLHRLWKTLCPEFPESLDVLDSGMLYPKKSKIAVYGITSATHRVKETAQTVSCKICPEIRCSMRREPYRISRKERHLSEEHP